MLPSKQNCQRMLTHLKQLRVEIAAGKVNPKRLDELEQFLRAAYKKLPNEASFPKPKKKS